MLNRIGYYILPAALSLTAPALAQTETIASVDGRILSSDGSRILYVPTNRPSELRIRTLSGQEQIIASGLTGLPTYGYLTPTGAIFAANIGQVTQGLFNFNGSGLQRVGSLNSSDSLIVRGDYAAFSGNITSPLPDPFAGPVVYRMNTTTGQIIGMPGKNGNTGIDITSQGTLTYWTSEGWSPYPDQPVDYNIVAFDGTTRHYITNLNNKLNVFPITDGTNFVFVRKGTCCPSSSYSELILSDGTTETILRSGTDRQPYYLWDYQINAGWVAYRTSDGTLMLRDPAGTTVAIGSSYIIQAVSEFGEVVFTTGTETFLRLASGQVVDIGSYTSTFNVGRDWYFYRAGHLVRYVDGRMVALDTAFAANLHPYTPIAGATLYGVSDIAIARAMTLTGQTTLDTRGYAIQLNGVIDGNGSLDVRGGGRLTLLGANRYTNGTSITDATLIGNTVSLGGNIANAGTLVFDQTFDGIFRGTISGSGMITKTGTGVLALAGFQPFSGSIHLNGGGITLQAVDTPSRFEVSAGTLSGAGRIGDLVVTGGVVRPGRLLASTGSITLGPRSTFASDLYSDGRAGQLSAAGAVTIGGGRLALAFAPGAYRLGTSWKILSAASVTGRFEAIDTVSPRLMAPSVSYDAGSVTVQLVLDRTALAAIAVTRNQTATADAASRLAAASPLLNELIKLSDNGIRTGLSSLSGELHASSIAAIADATTFARGALMEQLDREPGTVWGSAAARRTTIEPSFEAGGLNQSGRDYIVGADTRLFAGVTGGMAIWYGNAESTGRGGRLDYDQFGVALYGRTSLGPILVRGTAGWTRYDLKTDRRVAFDTDTPFANRLTGKSHATTLDATMEAGLPYTMGDLTLTPFGGVRFQALDLARLTETGGEASLAATARTTSRVLSRLGLQGKLDITAGSAKGSIRAGLTWEHGLSDLEIERGMEWPAAGGAPFRVIGVGLPDDVLEASLSAEHQVSDWSLQAGIHYKAGGSLEMTSARITARLGF
jgi:autotransporter-associated beta strand protein